MGVVDTTRSVGFDGMSLCDSRGHLNLQLPLQLPQFAHIRRKQGLESTISSEEIAVQLFASKQPFFLNEIKASKVI